MTFEEIISLKPGTDIYRVVTGNIIHYWYIGTHPKSKKRAIFGSALSVDLVKVFHSNTFKSSIWETEYEVAKEKMWLESVENLKSINVTYFDNQKVI